MMTQPVPRTTEPRLYMRGSGTTMDVATLATLLRETERYHGQHAAAAPEHHWSAWYAAYMLAREQGRTPEQASYDAALRLQREQDRQPARP